MQGKRRRDAPTKQEKQPKEKERPRKVAKGERDDKDKKEEGDDNRDDMMASTVTRVSMNRVKSTWPLLSETGQQEVMRLLEDASRPVIQAIPGNKKRLEFQETLSDVLHRTQRKLRKIPVPPNTRENFYKYDSLVNQREQLELALLPLLDQIAMLEQEIASEKKSVDRDQVYLDRIKRDAKNHKHAFATSTSVATELLEKYNSSDEEDLDDMPESIGLLSNPPSAFDTDDDQLNPILAKLTKSLTKIKQSTEGVDALTKACQKLESDLAMWPRLDLWSSEPGASQVGSREIRMWRILLWFRFLDQLRWVVLFTESKPTLVFCGVPFPGTNVNKVSLKLPRRLRIGAVLFVFAQWVCIFWRIERLVGYKGR